MLAALFNAVVLLLVTGAVTAEAVRRLFDPEPVGPDCRESRRSFI
jgi:Co/Zn/Cd efflux system component